jgi:hypothetical protein
MTTMVRTKDQSIVFQNQSHLVQRHFQNCGICPDLLDICLATDLMVDFGTNGYSKDLKERFDKMETYIESKYQHKEITELK